MAKFREYVALGCRDIRDVDPENITANLQQRIHRVTCDGEPEMPPGTRPYAPIPIQWSCHIEDAPGEMRHEEFLDLSGEPPMRALAERMIECLGDAGPVLMYTSYEEGVIKRLIDMYPDLEGPLQKIIDRLFDLHPVVKDDYYHLKMLGSWSIKVVLPSR